MQTDPAEHAGPHGGLNQGWSLPGTLTAGCFRRLPFHESILIRIKADRDPNYLDRLN